MCNFFLGTINRNLVSLNEKDLRFFEFSSAKQFSHERGNLFLLIKTFCFPFCQSSSTAYCKVGLTVDTGDHLQKVSFVDYPVYLTPGSFILADFSIKDTRELSQIVGIR